ncbi:MAG: hypothetical protein YYHSYBAR_000555 [Candidatus Fervidibacter sacchari]
MNQVKFGRARARPSRGRSSERALVRESCGLPLWANLASGAIIIAFLLLLNFYGDAWLVPWHDEVVIGRLAQNIAQGKGFRNDLIDDILVGADKRTYWQMPVYPFALSLWCKILQRDEGRGTEGRGFELSEGRWFSRLIGALTLLLLLVLAVRLRLPPLVVVLVLLWTATDLTFQFASNFVRPDILTCCLLMATVLLLTYDANSENRAQPLDPQPPVQVFLVGLLTALAVLVHPIALPCWLVSGSIVVKRHGWRNGLVFAFPFLVGVAGWLGYALLDWDIFVGQMKAHLAHKGSMSLDRLLLLLGITFWGIWIYLKVPLNSMPWLVVLMMALWIGFREKWVLPRWLMVFIIALYSSVTLGAEAWYPPLFVPFGYLLLAAIGWHIWQKTKFNTGRGTGDEGRKAVKIVLLGLALGWWVYQASVVLRHIAAVPQIRQQVKTFVAELEQLLPKNSVLLVGSFSPDPTLALLENRPDLQLYQLMPSRMLNKRAVKQLRKKLTHMLVLEKATKEPFFRGREIGRWHFDLGGLTKSPHQGVTIVLLEVGSQKVKAR